MLQGSITTLYIEARAKDFWAKTSWLVSGFIIFITRLNVHPKLYIYIASPQHTQVAVVVKGHSCHATDRFAEIVSERAFCLELCSQQHTEAYVVYGMV